MTAAAILAILAIIGLCLWFLFRRGSINDRAEIDVPIDDGPQLRPDGSVDGPGDEADPPTT